MPSHHSTVVGGSSAARQLNCPGSADLLAQLPKVVDHSSSYSIEGTALHDAMVMLITEETTLEDITTVPVNGIEFTKGLVDDALWPAMAYWDALTGMVDSWMLEVEVAFPGIEGGFGTCDVLARDEQGNITYVTDWKFGAGVGVLACRDGVNNEQLMFYACAARHTHPELFPEGCRVVLTIVQPRARDQEPITWVEIGMAELDEFAVRLRASLDKHDTKRGHWCKFQACQTICPHHTGPMFDLEAMQTLPVATDKGYALTLLNILDAAPAVENLIREARAQAHLLLSNGEDVPGWKLVQKRGTRQWTVDEATLMKKLKLRTLKLKRSDLYDTTLKSPAGVEKLLPKKFKLPSGLAVMVSSGTSIAPVTDKRPAVAADPDAISKILLEISQETE
jgi:hypothetical protein